jgi:hypothetical protein
VSAESLPIRPGLKKVKESAPLLKADVHLNQWLDFDVMSYLNHIGFFGSNNASDSGVIVPMGTIRN